MLMPAALTMTAASRVPVNLDTPEMDSPVQVSHLTFTFTHINYNANCALILRFVEFETMLYRKEATYLIKKEIKRTNS